MLSDIRANVSWLFPRGCRMAGIAPAIMSAFKAGSNKKIKSYASYFGLFIQKAKRFPEFLSGVLLMSHWHKEVHMNTLAAREVIKNMRDRIGLLPGGQIHRASNKSTALLVRNRLIDFGWTADSIYYAALPHHDPG